uniref:Uncharacterized protein n=1 Tax=Solanum lycopersicum TaxID=4081 RepID=A0A3Q7EXE5_SOLLC
MLRASCLRISEPGWRSRCLGGIISVSILNLREPGQRAQGVKQKYPRSYVALKPLCLKLKEHGWHA